MWLLALFDLPTETPEQRRAYARFRKDLLEDGFTMLQYSVYQRHCASPENGEAHMARMGRRVPAEGEVSFILVTERQYERMRTYWGRRRKSNPPPPAQLEFF